MFFNEIIGENRNNVSKLPEDIQSQLRSYIESVNRKIVSLGGNWNPDH